jgi:nucleotide-binding universal stress UspA family protein
MTAAQVEQHVALNHLLFATDFSGASENALRYAAALARSHASQLHLAHVIPPEPWDQIPLEPLPKEIDRPWLDANLRMKQLAQNSRLQDVKHHEILERGRLPNTILKIIQREEIDLLVLGTHGRTGLKRLFLGSVAEELFRSVPCPVLTVGPMVNPSRSADLAIHRILFATDFEAASLNALPYALALADENGCELLLLHVVTPMPVFEPGPFWYVGTDVNQRQEIDRGLIFERLRKLVPVVPPSCQIEPLVAFDLVPEGIVKVAVLRDVDVVVMGVRGSTPALASASAHIPWATAHEVICGVKCPVLTVRG